MVQLSHINFNLLEFMDWQQGLSMHIEQLNLLRYLLWAQLSNSSKSIIGLVAQGEVRPFLQKFL